VTVIYKLDSSLKKIDSIILKKANTNCKYPEPIPLEVEVYINKCSELYLQNKFIECVNSYNHLIAVYPDYCIGYYNRGLARYYSGDKEGAKNDFEKALNLGYFDARLILIKYLY
jgi:tetratricopeptide (TPR) repeat protein